MNGLRVVSLFDGISCGRIALHKAGYAVSYYAAFEIDKYAKAITRYNYPDTAHHGDVMDADFERFNHVDLLIGGSPCTTFSISQSTKKRETDKGGTGWELFMKFREALKVIKPKQWLFENVASMHKNIREAISYELGCEPIMINSALVSAQQRKRLYWTSIEGITQPVDRGILLQDILETGQAVRDKSLCIDANYYKGGSQNRLNNQSGKRLMVYEEVSKPIAVANKSQTILASYHKENPLSFVTRGKKGLMVAQEIKELGEGGTCLDHTVTDCSLDKVTPDEPDTFDDSDGSDDTALELGAALRTRHDEFGKFKRLEVRSDGKLNALTTVQTDSVVCSPIRIGAYGKGGQSQRIYSVKGKTVSISATGGGQGANGGLYKIDLPDGDYTIRKLSNIEVERAQGLPDDYTAFGMDDSGKVVNISKTQRYKAVGNGWQTDTVAHIFSFMKL